MSAELIYGGITAGGIVVGYFLRAARSWFGMDRDIGHLKEGYSSIKRNLESHEGNRDIHIDPRRDSQSMDELKAMLRESFASVNRRLDRIDERCAGRLVGCQEHFARIERKIAAATGKDNGS
jgi:hypothetical protein